MPAPRKGSMVVLVGTRKGAFLFRSDARRRNWSLDGPHFLGHVVHSFVFDPRDSGTLYLGTYTDWFGADIKRSTDWGRTWKGTRGGIRYERSSGLSVKCVWTIRPGLAGQPGVLYAGVDPAGMFRSDDDGVTWEEVKGLNRHPTRKQWQPGAGGLIAHTILLDPLDPRRIFTAISAAGVFRTEDAGRTWQPRNQNTRADFLPKKFPKVGQCVHRMAMAAGNPSLLYQQNHCGVYRTENAGDSWVDISAGLPSRFGFAIAAHPRDPETAWVVPLVSDHQRTCPRGCLAAYRSTNAGRTWQKQSRGLPTRHAHLTILRSALATDSCDPAGLYLGTETGQLFHSRNEGREWRLLADFLPPIFSVEAAML